MSVLLRFELNVALAALRAGNFYGSTGPAIIDVEVADSFVEVRTSPCRSITLCQGIQRGSSVQAGRLGYRHGGASVFETADDGGLVRVRLERREVPYGRLQVEDAAGRRGWTNPLWFEAA